MGANGGAVPAGCLSTLNNPKASIVLTCNNQYMGPKLNENENCKRSRKTSPTEVFCGDVQASLSMDLMSQHGYDFCSIFSSALLASFADAAAAARFAFSASNMPCLKPKTAPNLTHQAYSNDSFFLYSIVYSMDQQSAGIASIHGVRRTYHRMPRLIALRCSLVFHTSQAPPQPQYTHKTLTFL